MTTHASYDVIILGGGLAGLALGIQLKQARPETRILIAEKRTHPVPEAAFKVGESTVEIAAHYYSDVLGMKEHLETQQLTKPGLRFYFSYGDNRDIARRVEIGHSRVPKFVAYQLDRGRFENALGEKTRMLGVEFLDRCSVKEVTLNAADRHQVTIEHGGQTRELTARWVVDASGRSSLLKRKLDLVEKNEHDANAAWFRVGYNIDVDSFSDDPEWRGRVPAGLRRFGTNHLMGRGYWVWLIPLASNATSVGIVADNQLHPFDTINRFDRALEWLKQHEPQVAQVVEEHLDDLQDFRVLKHFSYNAKQVYSADRWSLVGEAGAFLDPFYSPGSDFIAIGNTFTTDLIMRDLRGEPIAEQVAGYNQSYFETFETLLQIYQGQYPLMGSTQAVAAKISWDYVNYWSVTAPLYFQGKLWDLAFLNSLDGELKQLSQLNGRMQAFFRDWADRDQSQRSDVYVDQYEIKFLYDLHEAMHEPVSSDDELRVRILRNIDVCRAVAAEMLRKAEALNPQAARLHRAEWHQFGLFVNGDEPRPSAAITAGLNAIWFPVAAEAELSAVAV